MKEHHFMILCGLAVSLLLPLYAPLHGAGLGVTAAGIVKWVWVAWQGEKA